MERRFLRKSNDKVIGGLCSGLAEYIGSNVILVRLITLFGIIASGVFPGLLLYVICLIFVPLDTQAGPGYGSGYGYEGSSDYGNSTDPGDHYTYGDPPSKNGRYIVGIGLIVVGVFLFARMFFSWLDLKYVFAGLLILGGLFMIFNDKRRGV